MILQMADNKGKKKVKEEQEEETEEDKKWLSTYNKKKGKIQQNFGGAFASQKDQLISEEGLPPQLKKWDPSMISLERGNTDLLVGIGQRKTGKSFLMRDILYKISDKFALCNVISETADMNHFWHPHVPPWNISSEYYPEILQNIIQQQLKVHSLDTQGLWPWPVVHPIVLDDIIGDQKVAYDAWIDRLYVQGRHSSLLPMMTTQYAKGVFSPKRRGNTDWVFLFVNKQTRQRDSIWEDFGQGLEKKAFLTLLDHYTEDRGILVINNTSRSWDLTECYYYYTAEEVPEDYRFGPPELWERYDTAFGDKSKGRDENDPAMDENKALFGPVQDFTVEGLDLF